MWLLLVKHWKLIAAVVCVLGIALSVTMHFRNDAKVRAELSDLKDSAQTVVLAVQAASGNNDVTWKTAPGQIIALGESNRRLKDSIAVQNASIDEMAREAVRLRKHASEMQAIAAKARAQRASALARLSDMAVTPGTRADCLQLLAEAEAALDIAHGALK